MPGTPPPYIMCAHFSFESMDTYRDAFYPHAETVMRDMDSVTRIKPLVQIGDIKYAK
jgi:hypothetical protein